VPAPAPASVPAPSPTPSSAAAPAVAAASGPVSAASPIADPRARATSVGDALIALNGPGVSQAAPPEFSGPERRATPGPMYSAVSTGLPERRELHLVAFRHASSEDFQVTGFTAADRLGIRLHGESIQQALRGAAFVQQLDGLREGLRREFDLDRTVSISVAGVSLGVSVAYVLWLVRGGVLLGSYLSALPAWRLLDPLPVLSRVGEDEEDDDEPLDRTAPAAPDPLRGFS
jgi:large repetitive protein